MLTTQAFEVVVSALDLGAPRNIAGPDPRPGARYSSVLFLGKNPVLAEDTVGGAHLIASALCF